MYTLASSHKMEDFVSQCSKLLHDGWTPSGGVCAVPYDYNATGSVVTLWFTQAFVKPKA